MMNTVFLSQLASARSETEFDRTAAGFAAFQVYDSVRTHGFGPSVHSDALRRVAADVARLSTDSRIRDGLEALLDALPFWESGGAVRIGRRATYTALLMYGQALGDEGEWKLAESIYGRIGMDTELDGETWLAAEARLLMGRASRMCAHWEQSATAYKRAYELALEVGDMSIRLRAQIGEANNLWIRGDFPAAKRRLQTVARRARESFPSILPRVTLAQAGIANASGEYERAIRLAFGLLSTLPDTDELKYACLVDLASFLSDYGLPQIASSALHMVEASAPEPSVRRHASLNLLFLAAQHGTERAFSDRRKALSTEPLAPRQQTQYALFTAQGLRRFGHYDAATISAERAVQLANRFELFQLVFESEAELREIESAREASVTADSTLEPSETESQSVAGKRKARASAAIYRLTTGEKLPPRMLRLAQSLESMARQYETAEFVTSGEM
ncbi:MAG: hypothetical protein ABI026_06460 [Gemmatimonadaceae bacterium]